MILYHGSNVGIDTVDLSRCEPYKDFGKGFYLTSIVEQAKRMAMRTARFRGGDPIVSIFEAPDDLLFLPSLNIRVFDSVSVEWAVFVINNRNRYFRSIDSLECNHDLKYDVVYGPVGNDDVTFLLEQFTAGYIDEQRLREGLEFKKASDQYSFHTKSAISHLRTQGVLNV